jgi:hypothetical protein
MQTLKPIDHAYKLKSDGLVKTSGSNRSRNRYDNESKSTAQEESRRARQFARLVERYGPDEALKVANGYPGYIMGGRDPW